MATQSQRYAVITGANKGIGLEICKQLASKGIIVVLTARNEDRGIQAVEEIKEFGQVVFHPLDVLNPVSIATLAHFIKTKYGRLDILVNNAGVTGSSLQGDEDLSDLHKSNEIIVSSAQSGRKIEGIDLKLDERIIETYEGAEECIQTNFYGAKRMTEAFIPLLQLSDSPRIVNVSSILGILILLPNEWAKQVLSNEDKLTEEKVDEVVQEFVKNMKDGGAEWRTQYASYKVSKAALNAYTRIIAKKYPNICTNCVCPGYARTDMTSNFGPLSASEAAERAVKVALLPDGRPSGMFFSQDEVMSF